MTRRVFISHASPDRASAEIVCQFLENRGIPCWIAPRDMPPERYAEAIVDAIASSAAMVLLFSAHANDSEHVLNEVERAVHHKKPIFPLMLDRTMPSREMTYFIARWHWLDTTAVPLEDLLAQLAERLHILCHAGAAPPRPTPLPVPRERNQQYLLDKVKAEVEQSLSRAVLIDCLKEEQPHQVDLPGNDAVTFGYLQQSLLPSDMGILEIFEQPKVAGKLLILGDPGAGKTTLLLQLADALLARAAANPNAPIPVLMNLSSWTDDRQPLASWLVAELKAKYGIRTDIGQRWLDESGLVLLLDGLDELVATRQEICVQAINRFQQDYGPTKLVVCCRLEACQHYKTKLKLHGAIRLLPCTDEQIQCYLVNGGRPELWQFLQENPGLLELVRSPLLLRLLTLAFDTQALQDLQSVSPISNYEYYIFETHIKRLFSETKSQIYTPEKIRHWLTWLAQRLQEQTQTEFLLEKLQPAWLSSPLQKWLYHIGVIVSIALIIAGVDWLKSWSLESVPRGELYTLVESRVVAYIGPYIWQHIDVIAAIIVGLSAGLIVGVRRTIVPIETLQWSGKMTWSGMTLGLRRWASTGLTYGTYVGCLAGLVVVVSLGVFPGQWWSAGDVWSQMGYVIGLLAGLTAGVAVVLTARPNVWQYGELRKQFASRWPRAVLYGLLCGLGAGFSYSSGSGLLLWLTSGLIIVMSHGLGDRHGGRWADTVVGGLVGGLGAGLVSWISSGVLQTVLGFGFSEWLNLCLLGGLGVGGTVGSVAGLITQWNKQTQPAETLREPRRAGKRWLGLTLFQELWIGLSAGMLVGALAGWEKPWMMQAIISLMRFLSPLGIALLTALDVVITLALIVAVGVIVHVALLGALLGALSGGLSGPEIERRDTPNQGIRQSAINIGMFALVGGLTLGIPWGLFNLVSAVLMTGQMPQARDWWHFGLSNVLFGGVLSGLIPGAACIQHFMLRFVLWCNGVIPWHYVRFLDFATERMFLQRVGGRYRFLHDLLRDRFAAIEPKRENN